MFSQIPEVRNFGPLLLKINGQDLNKFVYLRVNNADKLFEIIEVENETIICVRMKIDSILPFPFAIYVDHSSWTIERI